MPLPLSCQVQQSLPAQQSQRRGPPLHPPPPEEAPAGGADSAAVRALVAQHVYDIPPHDSWSTVEFGVVHYDIGSAADCSSVDFGDEDMEPPPADMEPPVHPNGADIVDALDRDARACAVQDDDEDTVTDAIGSRRRREGEGEDGSNPKKTRTEGPEAAPAEAAVAAASTRGPSRRQTMKSRTIVLKNEGSEKYSLVLSAAETAAEIDRVILARECAMKDAAQEYFGASTPEEEELVRARRLLVSHGRACQAQGDDGFTYVVFDFELQKRSEYKYFRTWASTPDGDYFLRKRDRRGCWNRIPFESEEGRFVIPRAAKSVFKTHCDVAFGGQTWYKALNQMGGCPTEFVDSFNMVIDQRLQVAF